MESRLPFALLPFLLLVIPIAEIAVFIAVGSRIGIGWTLVLTLLTAVAGSLLLRIQGISTLRRIRSEIDHGRIPGRELVHGVAIVAAGILLLTPGFITDALGLLLFLPPVRDFIWSFLRNRVVVLAPDRRTGKQGPPEGWDNGPAVDLDPDEYRRNNRKASPWRAPPGEP